MPAPSNESARRHPIAALPVPLAPLNVSAGESLGVATIDVGLANRIRGEFLEMRGFSPTLQQAERLFHLPEEVCRTMLASLVEEGFLRVERDGRFRLLHG